MYCFSELLLYSMSGANKLNHFQLCVRPAVVRDVVLATRQVQTVKNYTCPESLGPVCTADQVRKLELAISHLYLVTFINL